MLSAVEAGLSSARACWILQFMRRQVLVAVVLAAVLQVLAGCLEVAGDWDGASGSIQVLVD